MPAAIGALDPARAGASALRRRPAAALARDRRGDAGAALRLQRRGQPARQHALRPAVRARHPHGDDRRGLRRAGGRARPRPGARPRARHHRRRPRVPRGPRALGRRRQRRAPGCSRARRSASSASATSAARSPGCSPASGRGCAPTTPGCRRRCCARPASSRPTSTPCSGDKRHGLRGRRGDQREPRLPRRRGLRPHAPGRRLHPAQPRRRRRLRGADGGGRARAASSRRATSSPRSRCRPTIRCGGCRASCARRTGPGALDVAFKRMGDMVLEDMALLDRGLPPLRCKRAERETVGRMRSRPVTTN